MKLKLMLKGVEKEVILIASSSERELFLKKSINLTKIEKDEDIDMEEKAKVAIEFTNWLQELGLNKIGLTEEEKNIIKEDVEQLDIITKNLSEILQPFNWQKKS